MNAPLNGNAAISSKDFEQIMAAAGPFEARPFLAVAVSGGGDSMALCLLADRWAREREGRIIALTVDHGLRPESIEEARQVRRWLAQRRIDHHILRWQGEKPAAGLQAWARGARYELMSSFAAKTGALHLLTAHTMEDQAETFLIRLERESGIDGLSAMAVALETRPVRLVRPLLGVLGASLRDTLREFGQDWIEDPSNQLPRFARTHARAALNRLAGKGIGPERLAALACRFRQARTVMETAVAVLLARCCAFHPAGHAHLDGAILAAAPEAVSRRALARIILCIGAKAYPPRLEKLERLHEQILKGGFTRARTLGARTLGGCRITPCGPGSILICREGRKAPKPIAAVPGAKVSWDGCFQVEFLASPSGASGAGQASLGRLGRDGLAEAAAKSPKVKHCALPKAVRPLLPTLRDGLGVIAVPHLKYRRGGENPSGVDIQRITFRPPNGLS